MDTYWEREKERRKERAKLEAAIVNLKVGDKVIMDNGYGYLNPYDNVIIAAVGRVTKTLIELEGSSLQYRRVGDIGRIKCKYGCQYGTIIPYTDEAWQDVLNRRELFDIKKRIEEIKIKDLSFEKQKRILAIVEEPEPENTDED